MSDLLEAAKEIQATLQTPGWKRIEAILDEQTQGPLDELRAIATSSRCEQATGKTGIRLGNRAQALIDFKESVYDTLKILTPTRKGGS